MYIYQVLHLLNLYFHYQEKNLHHINEKILSLLYLLNKKLLLLHHHDERLYLYKLLFSKISIILIYIKLYRSRNKILKPPSFSHGAYPLPNSRKYLLLALSLDVRNLLRLLKISNKNYISHQNFFF